MSGALSRRRRDIAFWLLLLVIGAGLIIGSIPNDDSSRSSDRDSRSVAGDGFRGWLELLKDQEVRATQLDGTPANETLDPSSTLVGIDLGDLTDADVQALQAFVSDGGRLVTGGSTDEGSISEIAGAEIEFGNSDGDGAPLLPAAEVAGVEQIEGAGQRRLTSAGAALPVFGSADGALISVSGRGEGSVVVIATGTPLANSQLAEGDNAQLALNLVGDPAGGVRFLERLTPGEGAGATGLAALPGNWIAGFIGLIVAALVLILSRLRRLGPPEASPSVVAQARIGYADAMARTLARSKEPVEAVEPVRAAALARIQERGPASEHDRDMLAPDAERAGIPADEARVLAGPLRTPEDAVKATRALGRVWREWS